MIQDIRPHRLYNQFIPGREPRDDSLLFVFRNGSLMADVREGLRIPAVSEARDARPLIYLFRLDETDCFLCPDENAALPEYLTPVPARDMRRISAGAQETVFAAWTAMQLAGWYRDNRYCGRCGGNTEQASNERALVCPQCGRRIYPRIIPAVIVGVTNGDRLLLTKYRGRDVTWYALVAGFTEIGETLEETVAREVMEEAGLRVKNIRYYKSQPWGMASDILSGFFCDVDGDASVRLDRHELKSALWIPRAQIKGQPDNLSLTNEMMLLFRDGREPH